MPLASDTKDKCRDQHSTGARVGEESMTKKVTGSDSLDMNGESPEKVEKVMLLKTDHVRRTIFDDGFG